MGVKIGIASSAVLGDGVALGDEAVIMRDVQIGSGTRIGPRSVVCDGVKIGEGVVVGADVWISPHVIMGDGVIIGDGASLGVGAVLAAYAQVESDACVPAAFAMMHGHVSGQSLIQTPSLGRETSPRAAYREILTGEPGDEHIGLRHRGDIEIGKVGDLAVRPDVVRVGLDAGGVVVVCLQD